ncbi:MAG: ribonuclease HII, partial [Deltaproteobacteria bacterium]|nr:ribonuclease HII [Deltaproteobacteria bacterium]
KGFKNIIGVDEAGRGPLAGPVVSAAVVFSPDLLGLGIRDSKKLTAVKRELLSKLIYKSSPCVSVATCWPEEVDEINIHNAALISMRRAVLALSIKPDIVLIDGKFTLKDMDVEQKAVIGGDNKSVTIAAASIIAKTTRDTIMRAYHIIYPAYNFERNKGYPTKEHVAALNLSGPSPIHRRSFSYSGKK